MRIVVDPDLCQGHGVCESEAPEVFELGKATQVRIIDEHPLESQRSGVEAAVRFCPTSALRIIEED
jgi:ferredoxin